MHDRRLSAYIEEEEDISEFCGGQKTVVVEDNFFSLQFNTI